MFAPRQFARRFFPGRYFPPAEGGGAPTYADMSLVATGSGALVQAALVADARAVAARGGGGSKRRPAWERDLTERLLALKAERLRGLAETRTEEILAADDVAALRQAEREVATYRRLAAQAREAAESARAERERRATVALIAAEAAVAAAEVAAAWRRDEDEIELLLLA